MAADGGQGQLRRYHFRARLAFLALVGIAVMAVHAWAGLAAWLVWPDAALVGVLGGLVWHEREPVRFLLTWRTATAGVGLGHMYTTTNRKGQKIDKLARPQVRRLWYGPGGLFRVNVLPVAGHAVELEKRLDDLTAALGMSRGVIAERRPGLRSMRYVLEFRRAARIDVHSVELPRPRRAHEDGGTSMADLPAALPVLPMPRTAGADRDPVTGRLIGERREVTWHSSPAAQAVQAKWNEGEPYGVPVEIEYRPDLAPEDLPDFTWRRTGFDHVPPVCRPGKIEERSSFSDYAGCSAYLHLPEDERRRIHESDNAELPCSECPHVARKIKSEPVPVSVVPDGTDWRTFLSAVPVGKRADGEVWTLPLYDTQGLLVAGKSGAGKSGVEWSLNIGLVPALIAGVVELRGVDPKGNELHHGLQFFSEYADEPEAMIELLETAVRDMRDRKTVLREFGVRKFKPSIETPLVVVEVDELLMLHPKLMADPKLGKRANAAIITLLTQGRSFGFMLIGGIQDPRKEYLDQRDLFQMSVALRLDNEMAELVLSKAAVKAGANTNAIPLGPDGAGVGYVMDTERTGDEPVQVRAFWADDEAVKAWQAYLVDYRASEDSQRYEAAQKAAERVRSGGQPPILQEVVPLHVVRSA